ncbi:MAG: HlyD family efflux transporter periplasmic adaptor subunit [Pseudomonadota bacterium]
MSEAPTSASPAKRRLVLGGITLAFALAGTGYAWYYKSVLAVREDTENAYVGGNLVSLTSQVTGNVQEIRADETQLVNAGATLIKLDPLDADLALKQAEARLGTVVRQLRERYADVAQYDATLEVRKLALKNAGDDLARRLPLAAEHTVSGEEVAHARQAVDTARAALAVAMRQGDAARAAVAGVKLASHPSVLVAKVDYEAAWVATRRSAVIAPVTGYVAKRSVQVGSHVTPGASLLAIVPLDQLWVDANYKESELQNIRIGQPATVETDLYGSKVVYHGKVLGLSAGTGSAFSLLPAQNATGNWVKVVQRLPVRISLDPAELKAHPLRIGLSTVVSVDTRKTDGPILGAAAPAAPSYVTQAFGQPMREAEAAASAIVAKNLGS